MQNDLAELRDAKTHRVLREFRDHKMIFTCADVSADNTLLASLSTDGTIKLWSLHNYGSSAAARRPSPGDKRNDAPAVSRSSTWHRIGRHLAQRSGVRCAHRSRAWTGTSRSGTARRGGSPACSRFPQPFPGKLGGTRSPSCVKQESLWPNPGGISEGCHVWDLTQNSCLLKLEDVVKHRSFLDTMAFSRDGTLLVTPWPLSSKIRLWNAITGQYIATVDVPGDVDYLRLSKCGRQVHSSDFVIDITKLIGLPHLPTQTAATDAHTLEDQQTLITGRGAEWIWRGDGENVLWLPVEYRARMFAIHGWVFW
ncbi:hypothetical protein CTA2_6786 [Colletotrichum tanaceti]|uniref:Uncharacterized protein n=1 Tax=Colletotrichum tanaceti TaxID=1306861 RepID=A0A4U6X3N5_9PEZI|nr:hypothetical protein CTA2_6786 [Colletotrichum tanaceti]TKW49982.1 hypothetical protein CTA1_6314 [Colletotrichum tanaceti]